MKVMHITTVDLSLKFLVRPQLLSIVQLGGEAIGVSAPGPWVEDLTSDGIRHVALDASTRGAAPLQDFRAALQFLRVLRAERPDVLHTHNPKPGLYGRILGWMTRVPIVVNTVHGLYATPDDRILKRFVVYMIEAVAARFSDAELVQSSEDLALINKRRIAPRGKARLLGNGVDLRRFNPDRTDGRSRQALRAELEIADDQIVVGIVSRLVEEKGFVELFTAASRLGPRYTLVVVGPTDDAKGDALSPEVIATARASGVRFLGMRTDVDELYRAMDIFVLPSHREGFPRAAMEAAAMGLPVVASDIRGCREVVDHGVNGLLFPVRDAQALEAAIKKLGEDDAARARMGEAGPRKARTSFDEDQVVAIVLDTYRRLAHRKGLARLAMELAGADDPGPGDRPSS
jgi:glycosyltransferase involved in cell wall biosynthesis